MTMQKRAAFGRPSFLRMGWDMTDYYQVLGVTAQASEKDIKSAYRKLAKRYHPDVAGEDPLMRKRMCEIQEAYRVLGNPEKRSAYDGGRLARGKQGARKKQGNGAKWQGYAGQGTNQAGPPPDMGQFERFFGFHPGKGREDHQNLGGVKEKAKGPIDPEGMFASFFGKMDR